MPDGQKNFVDLNAELAQAWKSITKTKGSLPEAEEFKDKTGKLELLDRG